MFESGSIIFRLQSIGKQVFQKDLEDVDAAAKKVTTSTTTAGKSTEELGKKQDETSKKTKGLGNELTNMSEKGKQAASTVGRSLLGVGATLIAVTALAVKSAIGWETAWAGVTKTIDATPEQLDQIEDGLRGLSKVLPATHDEIAAVAEAAGQLGVASKDVVGFTKTMIDLGETTNLSSDEAATAIAQMMNIMQTAPADVDRLGSALVALGNNGASTEKDIILMAQRIAGAGKTVGLTEAEVLSLANALASVGIDVEAGGSAISRIMIDIAKQVSTNGKDLAKWAEVAGMSTAQFSKAFKETPAQAINAFVLGLGKINAAGGDVFTTLDELGQSDIRVTNALLTMSNSGDLLTKSLETGTEAWADNIALSAEAAKRYETTAAKLQIMQNKVNDAAIDLGQVFLPPLIAATDAIGGLASAVGDAPEWAQELTGGLLLTVGAIALFSGAILVAIPKVVEFRLALQTMKNEMPKMNGAIRSFGIFATAVAVATTAIMILDNWLTSLQSTAAEMENSILHAKNATELLSTAAKGMDVAHWGEIKTDVDSVKDALESGTKSSVNFFDALSQSNGQKGILNTFKKLGEDLGTLAATDLPGAQRAFNLLGEEYKFNEKEMWRLLSTMPAYRDALIQQATAQGIQIEGLSEAERKTVLLELAQGTGAQATKTAAAAYTAAATEVDALRTELDTLIETMNEANGVGQDAITANIDYQDALAKVDEQIKNARAGQEGLALTLDQGTQAGRDNMGMLVDLSKDAWDAAAAQHALDGNTEAYRQRLEDSRAALLQRIADFGVTGAAAEAIADSILHIPSATEWEIIAKTSAASVAVENFIAKYNGQSITLSMFLDTSGGNRAAAAAAARLTGQALAYLNQANGGKVNFYGNGGRENHIAQFARAGTMRVWAEPETGGEWYIPASPAKRAQSTQILAQAANEFGYQLVSAGAQSFAGGGRSSDAQIMSGRTAKPLRIEGTLDLGNGLTGVIRGVINDLGKEL